MDEPVPNLPPPRSALPVPTTFGGVAALARGPWTWLAGWQVLVALAAALVVGWSFNATWGRAFRRAADALPETGGIQAGQLEWDAPVPTILHAGPYLSVVVDPAGQHNAGLTADVTFSVERDRVALRSVFGWMTVPYPAQLELALGRVSVVSTVATWNGPVVMGLAAGVFFGLLVAWSLLATLYGLVIWAVSGPLGRAPTFGVAWRLAGAALLPPAVLMTAVILLYATRQLNVVGLLLALPIHLVIGWVYCLGGLGCLPTAKANPFETQPAPTPSPARPAKAANPFQQT